jgi:hypothetical protein
MWEPKFNESSKLQLAVALSKLVTGNVQNPGKSIGNSQDYRRSLR